MPVIKKSKVTGPADTTQGRVSGSPENKTTSPVQVPSDGAPDSKVLSSTSITPSLELESEILSGKLIPKSKGTKRKLPTSTTSAKKSVDTSESQIAPTGDEEKKKILAKPASKSDDVCVLTTGNKVVPVLRSVLAEASLELKKLVESNAGKSKINIDLPNPDILSLFVRKLTDKKDLTLEEAKELITAATKYQVDSLLHQCLMAFVEHTDQNNILEIKFLAIDSKNKDLNKHIDEKMPVYLKTLMKSNDFLHLSMDKFGKLIARENLQMSPENVQNLADAWLAHDKRGHDPSLYTQVQARVLLRLDENWTLSMLDEKPENNPLSSTDPSKIPGWIFLQSLVTPKRCIGNLSNLAVPIRISTFIPKNKFGESIKVKYIEADEQLPNSIVSDGMGTKKKRLEETETREHYSQIEMQVENSAASFPRIPKIANRPSTVVTDSWGTSNEDLKTMDYTDSDGQNGDARNNDKRFRGPSTVGNNSGGKFDRNAGDSSRGQDRTDFSSWGKQSANVNQEDDWGTSPGCTSSSQSATPQKNVNNDDDWGVSQGNNGTSQSQWSGNSFSNNNGNSWNNNRGGRGGSGRGSGRDGRGRGRDSFDRSSSSDWGRSNDTGNGTSAQQDDSWGASSSSSWSNSGGGGGGAAGRSSYNNDGQRDNSFGSRGGRGRGGFRGRGDFSNRSRENNWICPESSCGADNFGHRRECFKCHVPKPGCVGGDDRNDNRRGRGFRGGRGGSLNNRDDNNSHWGSNTAPAIAPRADDDDWDAPTPVPAVEKPISEVSDPWDDKPPTNPDSIGLSGTTNNTVAKPVDTGDDWDDVSTTDLPKTPSVPLVICPGGLELTTKQTNDDKENVDAVTAPATPVGTSILPLSKQDGLFTQQITDSVPINSAPVTENVPEVTACCSQSVTTGLEPAAEDGARGSDSGVVPTAHTPDSIQGSAVCSPKSAPENVLEASNKSVVATIFEYGTRSCEPRHTPTASEICPVSMDSDVVVLSERFIDPRVAKRLKVKELKNSEIEVESKMEVQEIAIIDLETEYRPKLIEGMSSNMNRGWNSTAHLPVMEVSPPQAAPGSIQQSLIVEGSVNYNTPTMMEQSAPSTVEEPSHSKSCTPDIGGESREGQEDNWG